jgi:hypothetical protein
LRKISLSCKIKIKLFNPGYQKPITTKEQIMKKDMFSLVATAAYAVVDSKKADSLKSLLQEKIISATDTVVAEFVGDYIGLCRYLTDAVAALHREGAFGHGKNAANLRQNLSRRFATAVERATKDFKRPLTLKGYAPFRVTEKRLKVRKTAMEVLVEKAEELGADEQALDIIAAAIHKAKERAEKRTAKLFQQAEEKRLEREVQESYPSIIALAQNGKTAEEIAAFFDLDQDLTEKAVAAING